MRSRGRDEVPDFDDALDRALHCYVRLVADAPALGGDCFFVRPERPASAYPALDGRVPITT